jgi:hypothetical protein
MRRRPLLRLRKGSVAASISWLGPYVRARSACVAPSHSVRAWTCGVRASEGGAYLAKRAQPTDGRGIDGVGLCDIGQGFARIELSLGGRPNCTPRACARFLPSPAEPQELRHEAIHRCPADLQFPRDLCCPEARGLERLDLAHIDARLATLVDASRLRLRDALKLAFTP